MGKAMELLLCGDTLTAEQAHDIIQGGYWLRRPEPGTEVIVAYTGALAPEVMPTTRLPTVRPYATFCGTE